MTPEMIETAAAIISDQASLSFEAAKIIAERALTAALGAAWRPIESAPKVEDGPPVLLWRHDAGFGVGWFVIPDSGNAGWAWDCKDQPTHWQPLPPPPCG